MPLAAHQCVLHLFTEEVTDSMPPPALGFSTEAGTDLIVTAEELTKLGLESKAAAQPLEVLGISMDMPSQRFLLCNIYARLSADNKLIGSASTGEVLAYTRYILHHAAIHAAQAATPAVSSDSESV